VTDPQIPERDLDVEPDVEPDELGGESSPPEAESGSTEEVPGATQEAKPARPPRKRLAVSPWKPSRPPQGGKWEDFLGWVVWLDEAYEVGLPVCWLKHEGLVQHLAALWWGWREAYRPGYTKPFAAPASPQAWHTHYFGPFRDRLQNKQLPGSQCRGRKQDSHETYSRIGDLRESVLATEEAFVPAQS